MPDTGRKCSLKSKCEHSYAVPLFLPCLLNPARVLRWPADIGRVYSGCDEYLHTIRTCENFTKYETTNTRLCCAFRISYTVRTFVLHTITKKQGYPLGQPFHRRPRLLLEHIPVTNHGGDIPLQSQVDNARIREQRNGDPLHAFLATFDGVHDFHIHPAPP